MEMGNLILYVVINFPKENMYWPIDDLKGRFTAEKEVLGYSIWPGGLVAKKVREVANLVYSV